MAEMGHTNPALALRIYAQAMRRDEAEVERLRALVDGIAQAHDLADLSARSMDSGKVVAAATSKVDGGSRP